MSDTRKDDYETIEQGLKSRDFNEQRQAYIARERINAESGESRGLRERLVEAHRHKDKGEIEKLHHQLEPENKRIKENVEKYYIERKGF